MTSRFRFGSAPINYPDLFGSVANKSITVPFTNLFELVSTFASFFP